MAGSDVPSSGTAASQYSFVLDNSTQANSLRGTTGTGNADQIDLYNPNIGVAQSLTWSASATNGSGTWNVAQSSNNVWSGVRSYYNDNDIVTFGNIAASSSVTIASGGVQPQSLTVSNSSAAYTFTGGPIAGFTSLNKTGSGLLTLASSNSYYLGTQITGGTLVAAAGDSSLGDPSGPVVDSRATLMAGNAGMTSPATLAYQIGGGTAGVGGTFNTNGATCTLSGTVSITGTFTKAGAGFLTLANTQLNPNAANDGLNVAAGTLQMINSINFSNSGVLTVQSGATAMFDNTNGSLGRYSTDNGGGWSNVVGLENGATINGNLVIPAAMHVNFDNGVGTQNVASSYSGTVLDPGPESVHLDRLDELKQCEFNYLPQHPAQ